MWPGCRVTKRVPIRHVLYNKTSTTAFPRKQLVAKAVLQGVRIPGLYTELTPVYDAEEAKKQIALKIPASTNAILRSFYSSEIGGIVRDPTLMSIPVEDRMFLHGHGACELCHMAQGYLYLLTEHVDRFLWSISQAGLRSPWSKEEVTRIILHTAAAGNKLNGFVRFWMTGGRGNFGVSVKGGKGPALYVLTTCEKPYQLYDLETGFTARTSQIPIHDTYYTTLQSNGNLPAVLSSMKAEQHGADLGVLIDEERNVISAGDYDIAIVTETDALVVVPNNEHLRSVQLQRIINLLETREDVSMTVRKTQSRLFTAEEAYTAREIFVMHPLVPVMGVVELDGVAIGDGTSGINTAGFSEMIVEDSEPRENSYAHIEIPYGYMTM